MRGIALCLTLILIMSASICFAGEASVEKAYSMYYQGKKTAAIEMIEDHIKDNPDPEAYYFLGYAYYDMQQMEKAAKYFNEAFKLSPFYSPIPKEKE